MKNSALSKSVFGIFSDTSFPKLKRVFAAYILPLKKTLALAIFFMILFALMEAASVKIMEPLFDEVFIDKNKAVLTGLALQIMILFIVKSIAHYLQEVCMAKVGISMIESMQKDLFRSMIRQDAAYFATRNSSSLLVHFLNDITVIRSAVLNGFTSLIKDSCIVIFMIGLMFWKSFEMAAVMFFLFPLGIYPVIIVGHKVKKLFKQQQAESGNLFAIISEAFQGIKVIKSYQLEPLTITRMEKQAEGLATLIFKAARIGAIPSPLMEFFSGLAIAATLLYGGWRITQGSLSTGAFMVFLLAIVAAYKPLKNLARLNTQIQIGVAAIDRIYSAMSHPIAVQDAPEAAPLQIKNGDIEMRNMVFSYTRGHQVLHDVSLGIRGGQTAAIVGLAGSGKSTILNLLLRFYDLGLGQITIDGQDIRQVTLESLRKNIAYVSQDVVLFEGSIADNIRLGRQNATQEELEAVARSCGAYEFISRQINGFDTHVEERGGNLSGGQKQLISIARAMLKDAPILLLDEPTSSLDAKSEQMVREGLQSLMRGRTTLIIAHRLSTIRNADVICVMEEGRLLERGSHPELLALDGRYAQLYQLQHTDENEAARLEA